MSKDLRAVSHLAILLAALVGATASAQSNPPISVEVNAAVGHPIDPRIYGASWADAEELTELGITMNRWGGNAMSRYNWAFSTANRCKDYFFYNIPDLFTPGAGANGRSADDFIGMTFDGGAAPIMTIPLLPLLPENDSKQCSFPQAQYPNQEAFTDPAWEPVVCGNGRYEDGNGIVGDGPRILGSPDPNNIATTYGAAHQANWIQHMVTTWGDAASGGVRFYSLDNEPSLWSGDHWDVHPDGASYDEVWGKMLEYGTAIKAIDPNALLTGPDEWGWSGYFMSGLDQENYGTPQANADRLAHDDMPYMDWLVKQAHDHEATHGVRIIDVLTVHYYPQSGEFWSGSVDPAMQELRNRSTRSLWDPDYIDESWIGGTEVGGARVRLIPRLKEWADDLYPGVEIGVTEYNWGDIDHINGATTQADILGIFGREGLDIGVRWVSPPADSFNGLAFRMYRNYDGTQSTFGDVSVPATAPDPDEVSVFAARRSYDDALTIMLIAKRLSGTTPTTVNVTGFEADGAVAERWQLDSGKAIVRQADVAFNGSLALTLPPQTITLLVIPGAEVPELAAPASFSATAMSTSSVALHWSAVEDAEAYAIERSSHGAAFVALATTGLTSYTDGALAAGTSYVYRVRATAPGTESPFSALDVATTVIFQDDPIVAQTTAIRAVHVTQLRSAVNAMRNAAGLPAADFGAALAAGNSVIAATHIAQLRARLSEARAAIGLTASEHTDPSLAGVRVKAVHLTELRNGVK